MPLLKAPQKYVPTLIVLTSFPTLIALPTIYAISDMIRPGIPLRPLCRED
jgi:hypothetical protein